MRALLIAPLVLALGACGDGEGTQISLNVNDPGGASFNASAAKDGTVAINAPGFRGAIKLPKIQLDAGDFDINGVRLPPGSKIDGLNIDGNAGDDRVRVTFTSPIAPAAVREWFQGKLAAKGFKLTAQGDSLSGTTDEGKPFTLIARSGGEGSLGEIVIAD
ncbi:hypothetical protein [Sphingomonas sp.]|uniref:hypothetical protein n=1 Tax=Sphingomonas sp. TaxID=28214 RepID=UPI002CFAB65F|nr:hypothetical protein [Sphingomonas sp.]HWK34927.1 hypothetical protein [Sphingomonas sp.]